ncbi:uncharacterized protein LOC115444589 [Manduca sexta]|uniref:uncharacterized protein LOC115444589 n=1 Tax=Manduca sexta TaxID=7130 RepID=UPI0011835E50|nr:uncharacterized protein LOC115444589 [Manduca sexta]
MLRKSSLKVIVLLSYATVIIAQSEVSRCFHYTWLGPKWNNESTFHDATCLDATGVIHGVPCVLPLVVSDDGTWPNVDYIWKYYALNASCILADNEVCATYTHYFNGRVEHSTSFCTKAVDENGTAITRGCYSQTNGSFATTVCFCRSVPGGVPCNNAYTYLLSASIFIFTIGLIINSLNINCEFLN